MLTIKGGNKKHEKDDETSNYFRSWWFVLTGCGNSAKEDALTFLQEQNDPEIFNTIQDEGHLESLDFELKENNYKLEDFLNEVEDASWSLVQKYDTKNEINYLKMVNTFSDAEQVIETFVYDGDGYSLIVQNEENDRFNKVMYDIDLTGMLFSMEELEGKYLYMAADEMNEDITETSDDDEEKPAYAYLRRFAEFNETLAEDSFKKEDKLITRTYSKEELLDFIELLEDNDESFTIFLQLASIFQDLELEMYDKEVDFSMDVVMDPKQNTMSATINLEVDNDVVEGSAVIEATWFADKAEVKLELPKEEDTLTIADYQEALSEAIEASYYNSEGGELTITTEE
ncbi:hypothetical protein M2139_001024 [Enterococcus sp. PF1-24]|uniref:hypothetical protein n=1 Tax=unclassified Enterococcus TaxID=2608891 RepID=UPI0024764BBF|nr:MULTISPECIES: hypothetical protein [unclassified Enterococcus]MDH6364039.1 hypothetical protein [Enterococcus sp. PFB1-1]MDH6401140.1 hypothetical protein [Enterococcus sp. PF1-24]